MEVYMKTQPKILKIALFYGLQLCASTSLYAQFELDDMDRESYTRRYNSLPSVEENNEKLKASPQFSSFLKEAEEIVSRYELEPYVGFRLIHSHFSVGENQVMTENYEVIDSVPSLVTSAFTVEEAKERGAVPASWIMSDTAGAPFVFETSTDPEVKTGARLLQDNYEFMGEAEASLRKHNLNHLLSLALLKRSSLQAKEGQMYLELNSNKSKRSVVQLWNEEDSSIDTIRTTWSFKGPKKQACYNVWACVGKNGSHVGAEVHW
jgi:hypothetical protein